ncbi:hypothetical protein P154DRAFT_583634 [Amniculicola lignicola CBS 123094]|uniref:PD-(D/E)XK nuclease-like domain-containing protein n=1 Tax=Amniculicola lignicola CBS 123094 TaxID=1392246 RepID=A0A6A5VS71_9PLEO|nr:hypothetical protein P154DRAFT_583634 [Amniculicola lignicola CBS 123094]
MATSPPISPSLLAAKTSRTASWVGQRPPLPPADAHLEHVQPSKRKRASSSPEKRQDKVMAAMERLEPGQVDGWEAIISDNALGVQTFNQHAFIDSPRNLSECEPALRRELQYTLKKVKQIYQRARTCKMRGRDKNAWCQVVIQPLVELALELSGNSKLLL